jgi:hypothetical protein
LAHGEEFTDVLAWWITQKYVAGPFAIPPLPDFRSNAMMAIEQKGKIRIIMNLSAPQDESYNDAIDETYLEKVVMSSARLFGYSVIDCGKDAKMWKFDMVDAYKCIPATTADLRLQGFTWLGRYFVELKKVFGSKEAVSAFDRLNHTLVVLAAISSNLPLSYIQSAQKNLAGLWQCTAPKPFEIGTPNFLGILLWSLIRSGRNFTVLPHENSPLRSI